MFGFTLISKTKLKNLERQARQNRNLASEMMDKLQAEQEGRMALLIQIDGLRHDIEKYRKMAYAADNARRAAIAERKENKNV